MIRQALGIAAAVAFAVGLVSCSREVGDGPQTQPGGPMTVFVSIAPQKQFVQRIAGDRARVRVMVGPGQDPHSYDPTLKQMTELSGAEMYFRIHVPFESAWMDRIRDANPRMTIVDTTAGIKFLSMSADEDHAEVPVPGEGHHHEGLDPHTWLDPRRVKAMAQNITEAFVRADPTHEKFYRDNLARFEQELTALDTEISSTLKGLRTRTFMAFHPSFGYFADAFGLKQVAVEVQGQKPSMKQLQEFIRIGREEKIKAILVQPQFSLAPAKTIAEEIGGKVIQVDPLAPDWFAAMKKLAEAIRETGK